MLKSSTFADPQTGYPAWIDVDSFVDFLLINELSRNVDGYRLSTYFYKDKDSVDPKLYMGPLWDFNLAFGNADYYDGSVITGLFINYNLSTGDGFHIPFWWRRLMQDPAFVSRVVNRWNSLRITVFNGDSLNAVIDYYNNLLSESQQRNFQRWDILSQYVWPNNYIGGSYSAEISYLKNWIAQRYTWLDYYFNQVLTAENSSENPPIIDNFKMLPLSPNPFNPATTITFQLPKSSRVTINIYDAAGRILGAITDSFFNPGVHKIKWDASGFSSGVYFIQTQAGNFRAVQKCILLK